MVHKTFGHYVCSDCAWKSGMISFGFLHGWHMRDHLKKVAEYYGWVLGKDYLKKELSDGRTVEQRILQAHTWQWSFPSQCNECLYVYVGLNDIVESDKNGKITTRCPHCNNFGNRIEHQGLTLTCPKCKKEQLSFHKKSMLIA